MRKKLTLVAVAAAAALLLASCASGGAAKDGAAEESAYKIGDPNLTNSDTFDRMVKADKIRIGVKQDQPYFGYLDAATGERTGFDIETARWIAASLGFSEKQIEFVNTPSPNRESSLNSGIVDLVVGTYSITPERKVGPTAVDFAGPYFVDGQGILVSTKNKDIKTEKDLDGKEVCSVTGSVPLQKLGENFPKATPVAFESYSLCVEELKAGRVDAVTTDQAILLGYQAKSPDEVKVVGETFSVESYGIGLPKGDDVLRGFINDTLEEGDTTWQKIFDQELSETGIKRTKPEVDRY
jgi:glutamate transport system substrate-binding protein